MKMYLFITDFNLFIVTVNLIEGPQNKIFFVHVEADMPSLFTRLYFTSLSRS